MDSLKLYVYKRWMSSCFNMLNKEQDQQTKPNGVGDAYHQGLTICRVQALVLTLVVEGVFIINGQSTIAIEFQKMHWFFFDFLVSIWGHT